MTRSRYGLIYRYRIRSDEKLARNYPDRLDYLRDYLRPERTGEERKRACAGDCGGEILKTGAGESERAIIICSIALERFNADAVSAWIESAGEWTPFIDRDELTYSGSDDDRDKVFSYLIDLSGLSRSTDARDLLSVLNSEDAINVSSVPLNEYDIQRRDFAHSVLRYGLAMLRRGIVSRPGNAQSTVERIRDRPSSYAPRRGSVDTGEQPSIVYLDASNNPTSFVDNTGGSLVPPGRPSVTGVASERASVVASDPLLLFGGARASGSYTAPGSGSTSYAPPTKWVAPGSDVNNPQVSLGRIMGDVSALRQSSSARRSASASARARLSSTGGSVRSQQSQQSQRSGSASARSRSSVVPFQESI